MRGEGSRDLSGACESTIVTSTAVGATRLARGFQNDEIDEIVVDGQKNSQKRSLATSRKEEKFSSLGMSAAQILAPTMLGELQGRQWTLAHSTITQLLRATTKLLKESPHTEGSPSSSSAAPTLSLHLAVRCRLFAHRWANAVKARATRSKKAARSNKAAKAEIGGAVSPVSILEEPCSSPAESSTSASSSATGEAALVQELEWQRHFYPCELAALLREESPETLLGERLFCLISCVDQQLTGKITGMLLHGLTVPELHELLITAPLAAAAAAFCSWVDAAHAVLEEASDASPGATSPNSPDKQGDKGEGAIPEGEWQMAKPRKRKGKKQQQQ